MNRRTTTGNELTIVRWKDKKPVYVASNCDSSEPQASEESFQEVVVIVVRIHKKVFQSVVLDFTTIVFRSGVVLCDT